MCVLGLVDDNKMPIEICRRARTHEQSRSPSSFAHAQPPIPSHLSAGHVESRPRGAVVDLAADDGSDANEDRRPATDKELLWEREREDKRVRRQPTTQPIHHHSPRLGPVSLPLYLVPADQGVDNLKRATRVEDVRAEPVAHAELDAPQDLRADDGGGHGGRIDKGGGAAAIEPNHPAAVLRVHV